LLGTPINFFVYSTMIYRMVRFSDPPQYGEATALASITLLLIAIIIPLQRWMTQRRIVTTVTGQFKPGLMDLGPWRHVVFVLIIGLIALLTIAPVVSLVLGSFMSRAGIFQFNPTFTMIHWERVLGDSAFLGALTTTFFLGLAAAIASPIIFSLIAYVLVKTRWPGRGLLDSIIWASAAIPGLLAGLGLLWMFLGTPFLRPLFGTIWILLLVVIIQGNTTGVNLFKVAFLQMGKDMEEAARVSGAGWWRTYFRIWIPLLMPTLILLGTINFVLAAQTTSSIVLLASRDTMTLSLLALEWAAPGIGRREEAGIVSLFIVAMSMGVALAARTFGLRLGVRHS
jgi:iron(III) transport system permease protein